jgi:protein kinase A
MIRRMTDKLGHLTHGHQKPHHQPIQGLPLPVPTHTHIEHRGSISTQRTSESSKRGESVDETRPQDESLFPYQRRPKGTYRLSDFYFQRTLGTGSFGRVHLGMLPSRMLLSKLITSKVRSKHNLRFYAIKVLQKEKIVKSKQIDHTNNEQQMLLAVQHPFIINLWGSFQDATNLYMVMDFVPGGELFTLLRRSNVGLLFFGCLNHSC